MSEESPDTLAVTWSPPRVGEGRRFRVLVHHRGRVACSPAPQVTLLDRTPADSSGPEHRFYFRADSPGDQVRVVFQDAENPANAAEAVTRIIAERDWSADTTTGEVLLPRVWPLDRRPIGLKTRHTLTPETDVGGNPGADRPAALGWSDDAIWNLVLPCDIPRWHFMNLREGCPIHGLAVFRTEAYYPWIVEPLDRPYSIQCPVGGEWFPSNDYAAGDFTSGAFPDDGLGFERDGIKFGMVSYALQRRIRFAHSTMWELSNYYRATGDSTAAHKLLVLLAAVSREYRYLATFTEHRYQQYQQVVAGERYRRNREAYLPGPEIITDAGDLTGSGMDDYCINMPKLYRALSQAYDLVFDRVDGDDELVRLASARMPWISTGPELRAFLEANLLRSGVQGALDNAISSNLPRPQEALLQLVRVIDQPECVELVDWLLYGKGEVAAMPVNFYYKDGAAYESVGYNGTHVTELIPLALGLRALCEDNPTRYPPERYDVLARSPRLRHIFGWPVDMVIAGRECPYIGDTGEQPSAPALPPKYMMDIGNRVWITETASAFFPDDARFPAALAAVRREEAQREALRANPDTSIAPLEPAPGLQLPSRLSDGYGVGILESGEGDERRGVWLYYGDHPHHAHDQRLDMGLVAHRRNLLRHMGYPASWEHMGDWDANWLTHYGVKLLVPDSVVRVRSTVRLFHGQGPRSGPFQIVEALGYGVSGRRSDEGHMEAPGFRVRRALCLVDLPDGRFYVVDFFRAEGGISQWWTFHGPPGMLTSESTAGLARQETGTAAGPEFPYGAETPETIPESLANLYDVRRGDVPVPFSATWDVRDAGALRLRMTQVAPESGEVIFARGRSPHAPAENPPYELDWVLRRRSAEEHGTPGEPVDSEYITVIEADSSLPLTGWQAISEGDVTGVRVETDDVIHWVLRSYASGPSATDTVGVTIGDVRFSGRAGFIEVAKATGRVGRATLVGGGAITWRGEGITRGAEDWTGAIEALDPETQTAVIRSDDAPGDILGRYLMVERAFAARPDGDCFAYRVESVEPAGEGLWRLRLNWPWVTAQGTVSRPTDTGFSMTGKLPLGRVRTYYRGSYLLDESRSTTLRVLDAGREEGDEALVVVGAQDREAAARAFPSGTRFTIEEIGVGDSVVVSGFTQVNRQRGSVAATSSGPYDMSME